MQKFPIEIIFLSLCLAMSTVACSQPVPKIVETESDEADFAGLPMPQQYRPLDNVAVVNDAFPDFKAGYLIQASGENLPAVVREKSPQKLWLFPDSVNGFFQCDNAVCANDNTGTVFQLNDSNWTTLDVRLKPWSAVMHSEGKLWVACTRPPMTVQSGSKGECYSVGGKWSHSYSLRAEPPLMCGERLKLISLIANGWYQVLEIDLNNGDVLSSAQSGKQSQLTCD